MKTPYDLYLEKEAARALDKRIQSGQLSNQSLRRVGIDNDQIRAYRDPSATPAQKLDAIDSMKQTTRSTLTNTGPKNVGAPSGYSAAPMHAFEKPKPVKNILSGVMGGIKKLKPLPALAIGAGVGIAGGVIGGNMMSDKSASLETPYDLYMNLLKQTIR